MASHGRIGEFNPQREDWTSYIERLKEYFIANDLEEATKQKAILLSVVGGRNISADEKLNSSQETDREVIRPVGSTRKRASPPETFCDFAAI